MADDCTNRLDTQSDYEVETLILIDLLVNQLDVPSLINIEQVSEPEDINDHLDHYQSVDTETYLVSISPQSQINEQSMHQYCSWRRQTNRQF